MTRLLHDRLRSIPDACSRRRRPRPISAALPATGLAAALALAACGGTVVLHEDDGGGGASAVTVSSSSGMPQPGAIMSVHAPTQYTVRVQFNGAVPEEAKAVEFYSIGESDAGNPLPHQQVEVAPSGDAVVITTARQKLGIAYALGVAGANNDSWSFPAADTAQFWTVDLSSPGFGEYQVTANRVQNGQYTVVYMAQGEGAFNVATAVDYFDGTIYPIETGMFYPAPDQDDNGKVVLLGVDGKGAFGGYFNPLDTLTDAQAQQYGYHSNETEVLYLNVEDGVLDAEHVVSHEFMHMIYHAHPAHDSIFSDWSWHNEGMAECGVRAVTGANEYGPYFFVEDPFGDIAQGLSLVDWQGGNYSQYALSYLFLSYAAGQLGGVMDYPQLFELTGSPPGVGAFLEATVGLTFAQAQRNAYIAAQVQAPSGLHSYNGLVNFPGLPAVGSAPLSLPSFSGVFVQPQSASVSYPGTQGASIEYVGFNGQGQADLSEPFDASGGRLLVFNSNPDVDFPVQPSGNLMPALDGPPLDADGLATDPLAAAKALNRQLARAQARLHPPPFNPTRLDRMRAWQRQAGVR